MTHKPETINAGFLVFSSQIGEDVVRRLIKGTLRKKIQIKGVVIK